MIWETINALPPAILLTLTFIFSLLVGSFLNVAILRTPVMMMREYTLNALNFLQENPLSLDHFSLTVKPSDELSKPFSLVRPRSHCPACERVVGALENIPVISFILLRGKCRGCQTTISWRYPIIEIATAVLTVLAVWKIGFAAEPVLDFDIQTRLAMCFLAALFTWVSITLTVIDIDTQLLPDSITLPFLWLGLIANLTPYGFASSLGDALIGAIVGYLSLWSLYHVFKLLTGKEGMGFGDFKLLAALGAWLGWQSLPLIVLIASVAGSATGLFIMAIKKRSKEVPIAFGPFLCLGGWIALLWGGALTTLYLGPTLPLTL